MYFQPRYNLNIHRLKIPKALVVICNNDVNAFFSQPWLFVIMIDVKKMKHIKNIIRFLPNEYDSSLVQEKAKEFFKSLYSVKGL